MKYNYIFIITLDSDKEDKNDSFEDKMRNELQKW